MGNISDFSDLVNLMSGGGSAVPQYPWFWKDARVGGGAAVATIAGRLTSLFTYEGIPAHGSAPGAVAVPTNDTPGGLRQTDPGGSRQLWLAGAHVTPNAPGTLIIYDRLLHISGLSGTNTAAQTVGGTLTRYTNGIGNQIWVEIYTQIGTSNTTFTCQYTDEDGNASQTSQAIAIGGTGLREVGRIIPVNLAPGDKGVRAVANIDLVATTSTAGDIGITVAHPLAVLPCPLIGAGVMVDFITGLPGLIEVLPDACLSLAWVANGTTQPFLLGGLTLIEK